MSTFSTPHHLNEPKRQALTARNDPAHSINRRQIKPLESRSPHLTRHQSCSPDVTERSTNGMLNTSVVRDPDFFATTVPTQGSAPVQTTGQPPPRSPSSPNATAIPSGTTEGNHVTGKIITRRARLRDAVSKLIRPARLKAAVSYWIRGAPSSSSSASDSDHIASQLVGDEMNDSSKAASPQATTRPRAVPKKTSTTYQDSYQADSYPLYTLKHPPVERHPAFGGPEKPGDSICSQSVDSLFDRSTSVSSHTTVKDHLLNDLTIESCHTRRRSSNRPETNSYGWVHRDPSRTVYEGPYSSVYRGLYKRWDNEEEVAIKVVKPIGPKHAIQRRLHREVKTGMILQHPNILPVYGVAEGEEFGPYGGIITPWCPNGNAAEFLHKHDLSPLERYRLWRRVVDGLVHLHEHSPQIVHGDMKPPNVLIADDGRPMICDLGLARLLINDSPSSSSDHVSEGNGDLNWMTGLNTTTTHLGTPRYLAPEQLDLNHPSPPTTATDIYAVGCIGFEFIYSTVPYAHREHNNQGQIFHEIRFGTPPARRSRFVTTPHPSSSTQGSDSSLDDGLTTLWDIFEVCWDPEPRYRPTAPQLQQWLIECEDKIVDALEKTASLKSLHFSRRHPVS